MAVDRKLDRGTDRVQAREPDREAARLQRKERRHAVARAEILEAARKVLLSEGTAGFTIAAIAGLAGMSKPSVYYYFPSKEAVMGGLVVDLLKAEVEDMEAVIARAPDGFAALSGVVTAIVRRYREDLDTWRLLYLWSQVIGAPREVLFEEIYPLSARVNAALEKRLQEEPDLHPDAHPRRLANMAWFTAHGLLSVVASMAAAGGDTRFTVDALCEEACGTLVRGARRR